MLPSPLVVDSFARHRATVVQQPTVDTLLRDYLTPIGLGDEPVTDYEHVIAAELDSLRHRQVRGGAAGSKRAGAHPARHR